MGKRIVWTQQARADLRGVEQPIALQILRTLGRFVLTGEGAVKQMQGVSPPMLRLRAQNHRVFFRAQDGVIVVLRVLDRKDAYR